MNHWGEGSKEKQERSKDHHHRLLLLLNEKENEKGECCGDPTNINGIRMNMKE
jgi:hypothetical protein